MLIINIPKSIFYIEVDELNYTLVRGKTVKTGNNKGVSRREVIGYYSSLPSALRRYTEIESIKGDEKLSLEEYALRFESTVQKVLDNKYDVVEVLRSWKKTAKKKLEEQ